MKKSRNAKLAIIAKMPLDKKCVLLEMLLFSVKEDLERLQPGASYDLAPVIVAYLKFQGGRCVLSKLEERFEEWSLEFHVAIETLHDLGAVAFQGQNVYLVREGVQ